ncbi:hypothetical protein SASC598O02_009600 [Snodgrassella alvi SCGC AB-598-O02]|nr:hypothetical protein SASC598O02_009600 [Snodgrassella alvi SCGC AB-598-O02]
MRKSRTLFFVISLIYIIVITSIYVSQEHNIYYWDYRGYWIMWEDLSNKIIQSPYMAVKDIIHSIDYDDYNPSPILILTIFKFLPISSRLAYILAINLIYLFPIALIFALLQKKISNTNKVVGSQILDYILVITFVPFWVSSLRGFPDLCGLFFIILSIYYVISIDLTQKIDLKNSIKIGLCLWLAFLLRRWYAYTIVSLYVTLPFLNIFYNNKKLNINLLKYTAANFFLSGLTSIIFVCLFQKHLLLRIFSTNYSYIYSAYRFNIGYSIKITLLYSGILFCLLALIFSIIILRNGNNKSKVITIFSWSNLILSFSLFTHTQSVGQQHIMPFTFWILFLFSQGIYFILEKVCKIKYNLYTIIGLSAFLTISHLSSLFNIFKIDEDSSYNFLPKLHTPLKTDNYSEYIELVKDIEYLTKNNKKITVFSSSSTLNSDLLDNLSNKELNKNLTYESQIDLRDGFRVGSIMSEYVVVTDPIQLHVNSSGQKVIFIPASDILSKKGIGKAYSKISRKYLLKNNTSAWIYKKDRAFRVDEVDDLLTNFYQYYPMWKKNYSDNKLILSYLNAAISRGDLWGVFDLQNDGTIIAHPGENEPTIVNWTLIDTNKLKFTPINRSCNIEDRINIEILNNSNERLQFYLTKTQETTIDVSKFKNIPSKLIIKKVKDSGCDAIKITFVQ